MDVPEIKQIENLFVLDKGKKITGQKIKRLTEAGQNYGSLMLSLDITTEDQNGKKKEIKTVAKLIPPNEFIQEIFNTQVTFRNEIGFYKTIVPKLQNFQTEHGIQEVIDCFPKYYGSRLNLEDNSSAKVDSDAALVLENLVVSNYVNFDRTQGFDLEVTKLVLKDLAHLHAIPLALKLQKPKGFDEKVKPFLSPWKVQEDGHKDMTQALHKIVDGLEVLKPFEKRIFKSFAKLATLYPVREPFATIAHNDVWVNNIMVKVKNGKAVKTKLVDFQICGYGSPARDILFFLYSSAKITVLRQFYDNLIKYYHDIFISTLKDLGCDVEPFSFEAFEEELNYEGRDSQFGHIVFMLNPIFAPKHNVKEISEFNRENMLDVEVTPEHKEKLIFIVKEFAKRDWI